MEKIIAERNRLQAEGFTVYHVGSEEDGNALGLKQLQSLPNLQHVGFGDFIDELYYYRREYNSNGHGRLYVQTNR